MNNEVMALVGHHSMIEMIVFSPDGRRLASSAKYTQPAEIKLWDLAEGRELLSLKAKANGSVLNESLTFSPDGDRLFYIPGGRGRDAVMQVWDATPLPDEPLVK